MNPPKTLLDGALLASSALIHSVTWPATEILAALRRGRATEVLDLRGKVPADSQLRAMLGTVLSRPIQTLIVLTGWRVPDFVPTVLNELADGALTVGFGQTMQVPNGFRLIALSPSSIPDDGLAMLFAARLAAPRAFETSPKSPALARF
jgi:hypothetical protein